MDQRHYSLACGDTKFFHASQSGIGVLLETSSVRQPGGQNSQYYCRRLLAQPGLSLCYELQDTLLFDSVTRESNGASQIALRRAMEDNLSELGYTLPKIRNLHDCCPNYFDTWDPIHYGRAVEHAGNNRKRRGSDSIPGSPGSSKRRRTSTASSTLSEFT